jgi:hypothetical protein
LLVYNGLSSSKSIAGLQEKQSKAGGENGLFVDTDAHLNEDSVTELQ